MSSTLENNKQLRNPAFATPQSTQVFTTIPDEDDDDFEDDDEINTDDKIDDQELLDGFEHSDENFNSTDNTDEKEHEIREEK